MQFSQANSRRRRFLADDLSAGNDAANRPVVSPPSRTYRRIDGYSPRSKAAQQRRLIDLVPRTYFAGGIWLAAGLTVIVGLVAGQIWLPSIAARTTPEAVKALDMGSRGSLAAWVASMWLALAAVMSVLIYSIRRHKLNDYRARYRWWLLAAVAWFTMSIDTATGLHQLFAATMVHLTHYKGPMGGAMWWIGCSAIFVAGLSARLAWEMRVCRPAMWVYLSALALWAIGLTIQTTPVRLGPLGNFLPAEISKLLGHLLLLFSLGAYARHVILHAQGLLPSRRRRSAKQKTARAAKNNFASSKAQAELPAMIRSDLHPHVVFPPADESEAAEERGHEQNSKISGDSESYSASGGAQSSETDEIGADSDSYSSQNRKLSKAERKRLRKQRAREEQGW